MKRNSKSSKNQVAKTSTVPSGWNALSKEEQEKRISDLQKNLKASTWRDLETKGKFDKNQKISFISDDMLIVGCDVGSETHYIRAIDTRGREISEKPFPFANNGEGFEKAKAWMIDLAAKNDKKQIVMGLEPTGHYWFCLAMWMVKNGITVVQVNPYAVKQTKEIEDNSQLKDDRKDPKSIANLVKDGNFGMPYIPEGVYADLRGYVSFRDRLLEEKVSCVNRLHRDLTIVFPEYKDALGKIEGKHVLELLKRAPLPEDYVKLGAEGLKSIWKELKMKGRCSSKPEDIVSYASKTVGLKEGSAAFREEIMYYAGRISELIDRIDEIEKKAEAKCLEIPYAENILDIEGIGPTIMAGMLAEIGDISRFDSPKELQKLSGLALVANSSGKHQGETKISHRGRKRLRYYAFQGSRSAAAHSDEFRQIHAYYTTRATNPLKKMQSLIAISGKLLRVVYVILTTGCKYDAKKLAADIRLPEAKGVTE